ncbi:MAG TPA: lysophospholipid acyltransferase family protein, partial [Humisphaera sp.]
ADRARLARGVIRSFYLFCLDVGRSAGMTRDQLLAENGVVEGFENYEAAKSAGKGLIVATAHMGSFEVGLAQLSLREPRVHVIFRRDAQGGFERQRSELRHRLNVIEHPVDDGWQMWIGLRDALLAGDAVVFQGDRVMPGQRGKRVRFLHGTLELPTGPVKLARLTGAPVLPVFTARDPDGRIKVMIDPAITVAADDRPTTDGTDPMLAKLAATIERRVAEFPDQWLMFHRAFCEDAAARAR